MIDLPQHDLRKPLTDELHARPFLPIGGPAKAICFAFLPEQGAERVSAEQDLAHLNALLAHMGAPPVAVDAERPPNFYTSAFDGVRLKWERHSEFVSFMLILEHTEHALFTANLDHMIPKAWVEEARLKTIAAIMVEVQFAEDAEAMERMTLRELTPHFESASLTMSWVTDHEATAMSDFRIDQNGFTRFAIVAQQGRIGPRRLGRVAQRLIEMETYRILAMTALPMARRLAARLGAIEAKLAATMREIAESHGDGGEVADRRTLDALSGLSADLEKYSVESAFRFGASRAYEAIVYERIEVLREERLASRPTFGEFMLRRFKPALRTIHSVEDRLNALSQRAERAANLLRTRIDVSLEAQNQQLLKSMNQRAQLQLRLQETVEGLSVVAISYYAVSLAGYVLGPLAKTLGGDEKIAKALVALPVIAAVWWMTRQVKKRLGSSKK